MGQKVNPNSLRFGLNKNWVSRWNAPNRELCAKWLLEDEKVRKFLMDYCRKCGVAHIEIERFVNPDERISVSIYMHLSQVGLYLSDEEGISHINRELKKILGRSVKVNLEVRELENPAVSAVIIGQEIVDVIQARSPHRIVVKRLMRRAQMSGAKGIKIKISGRINGVEIARSESYAEGSVPLSTLRADIDYSFQTLKTSYGILGIKVWVNRGLYFGKHFMSMPPMVKTSAAPWRNNNMGSGNQNNSPRDNKYISKAY